MTRQSARAVSFAMLSVVLAGLLLAAAPSPASANPRYAGLVIDAVSGEVLYADQADALRYPASLTKMMTLYMVFRELEAGRLALGSRITFSRHADAQPASDLGVRAGGSITVEQAIYALVTRSANDVAAAVGEAIGGTERAFGDLMTRQARLLGMTNTTFRNASGLPDRNQRTTASDIARLAQALMRDFPQYYHYFSTRSWSYSGRTYRNHNRLLGEYPGMDGLKTGYIRASGYNLAASVTRGELRVIGVVFGGRSSQSRNAHMVEILDRVFASDRGRYLIAHGSLPFTPPYPTRRPGGIDSVPGLIAAIEQGSFFGEGDVSVPLPPPVPDRPGAGGIVVASAGGGNAGGVSPGAIVGTPITALRPDLTADRDAHFVLVPSVITPVAAPPPPAVATITAPGDLRPSPFGSGNWGLQIGAFDSEMVARDRLSRIQTDLATLLGGASPEVRGVLTTTGTIYRARLLGMSYESAATACARLMEQGEACITLAPP